MDKDLGHELIDATRLEWRRRPDGQELILRVLSQTHPIVDIRFPLSAGNRLFEELAALLGKSIPENRRTGKGN